MITTQRVPALIEKGVCLEYRWDGALMNGPDLPLGFDVDVEPMRCGGAFSCSSYLAANERKEAA